MSAFFKEPSHQYTAGSSNAAPTHTLHLSDSKTRYSRSLPIDRDALPSRLQLMLYHRLLAGLVAASPSPETLDLRDFWTRVQVIPSRPFSRKFCEQSGLPLEEEGSETEKVWCINDLLGIWTGLIAVLGIQGVDKELTLVYRARSSDAPAKGKEFKGTDTRIISAQSTEEEMQIAGAIKASLLDIGVEEDTALAQALAESLRDSRSQNPTVAPSITEDEFPVEIEDDIIGSKVFLYDEAALDNHLEAVFDWWHGIRPPKGVDIEDSGRCR